MVGLFLESLTDFVACMIGGTAGLFIELPVLPPCLSPGSFFISLPLGLLDLRPLLRRRNLLLDGDLLPSLLEDEPAEVERVVVLRRRLPGGFCGDGVGRGPKGTRLALPPDLVPPGLLSSFSFFIFRIKPDGAGPKLIPAAIAPKRFCNGACDLEPIRPSGPVPLGPCSDLILTTVTSFSALGVFERFLSLLISAPPCFLAIYSGDEDLALRLR